MTADESVAALKELLLAEIAGTRALIAEKDGRYADLVTVKMQGCLDLLREKDALYTDRDTARQKAVEAALKAAQTGVDAAFAASEKAIGKSDQNAEKWRENANEWRAAMQDREVKFAQRDTVENEFKSLRTELASLKELRGEHTGERRQQADTRALWLAGIATLGLLLTLLTFVLRFTGNTPAAIDPTMAAILTELKASRATAAAAPQVIYVPSPPGTLLPSTPPAAAPR